MTTGGTAGTATAAPTGRRTSTTRRTLSWLRLWLLVGIVVVLAGSQVAFWTEHLVADQVRQRTVQAIIDASAGQQALVAANAAVAGRFQADDVQLSGPGDDYQNDMALATQDLQKVAAVNVADDGEQILQLLDGQLVAYAGLVEQAHVDYAAGNPALGVAELWYAGELANDNGIVSEFDGLTAAENAALRAADTSNWTATWVLLLLWVLPAVALLVLLAATQRYLSRRFRRTVNGPLLAATVLLLGLLAGALVPAQSEHQLGIVRTDVANLLADRTAAVAAMNAQGQRSLAAVVAQRCPTSITACGPTVATATVPAAPTSTVDDQTLAADAAAVTADAAAADDDHGARFAVPALAVMIAALILLFGLQPRIDEYRYRGAR